MALTLETEPADIVTPYRPVEWELTTDRTDEISETLVGVGDLGGYANYVFLVAPSFLVGDVVLPSIPTLPVYNVPQTITAITGAGLNIVTDHLWVGSTTGGTLTRVNDNFRVRGEIYATLTEPEIDVVFIANYGGQSRIHIANHGYSAGDWILIAGTDAGYYDGYIEILLILDPNQFIVDIVFAGATSYNGSVQKLSLIGSKSQQAISVDNIDIYRFDVSNFLQTIVSFDLPVLTGNTLTSPNTGSINVYIMKFIEQFNDPDGLLQDNSILLSSIGDKFSTNITLQHLETQSLTAFTVDSSAKRFLTNIPSQAGASASLYQVVGRNEYLNLAFLTNETQMKFTQIGYNSLGGTTETFTPGLTTIIDSRGILRINVSSFLATTVTFTVMLKNSSSTQRSEILQFRIDDKCYDQSTRVWWLNLLGGMDSFTLTGDIKERIKSKITSFDRRLGAGFSVTDRGTTALGIKTMELFEVHSDFLSVAQRTWLSELLTSPVVFLEEGSDLIPIINLSKTVTRRQGDELSQVKLSYTLSNNSIIQTG